MMWDCMNFQITFVDELGEDGGGLSREFFTLFGKDMARKYLEVTGVFRHDAMALKVCGVVEEYSYSQ